jgi:hypothetical protein
MQAASSVQNFVEDHAVSIVERCCSSKNLQFQFLLSVLVPYHTQTSEICLTCVPPHSGIDHPDKITIPVFSNFKTRTKCPGVYPGVDLSMT